MGYVRPQCLILPLLNAHQTYSGLLIPVSPDKVIGKLDAQLLKGTNRIECQPPEPNPCNALTCSGEGSGHNLVCHSLQVH